MKKVCYLRKNRRTLITIFSLLILSGSSPAFCQSKFSVKVGNPEPISNNLGDTWVTALSVGDTIYSPSNDTKGFYKFTQPISSNIAFNKITVYEKYPFASGITINQMVDYSKENQYEVDGCTWKSSGCYAVDSVIYWVIARHKYGDNSGDPKKRQTASNASIIKSYDLGKTWTRGAKENYDDPMFPGNRFATA